MCDLCQSLALFRVSCSERARFSRPIIWTCVAGCATSLTARCRVRRQARRSMYSGCRWMRLTADATICTWVREMRVWTTWMSCLSSTTTSRNRRSLIHLKFVHDDCSYDVFLSCSRVSASSSRVPFLTRWRYSCEARRRGRRRSDGALSDDDAAVSASEARWLYTPMASS